MATFTFLPDQAARIVCSSGFHRILWLPETATHSKLKVTFSTTTNFDDLSLPAILFIGQMYATRWTAVFFDKLARDCGVRVICVDRPGFGGSTAVGIDVRMQVWLETVPALLQQLDIDHVSIVTHSAGAVYTLNTLFHHRSILDPKAPYVAFLAPWVPTAYSGAILMTMAAKLPSKLLNRCDDLITIVVKKVKPSASSLSKRIVSSSTALFSSSATPFSSSASKHLPEAETSSLTLPFEQSDFDAIINYIMKQLASKYQFAESLAGVNEEVKLCLRKCDDAAWGEAADYSKCIHRIAANEATLRKYHQPNATKLSIDAFFGGTDIMIAKRGQKYFEQCWQRDEITTKIDFTSRTCPKANHNDVLVDYKNGALAHVFSKIGQLGKNG